MIWFVYLFIYFCHWPDRKFSLHLSYDLFISLVLHAVTVCLCVEQTQLPQCSRHKTRDHNTNCTYKPNLRVIKRSYQLTQIEDKSIDVPHTAGHLLYLHLLFNLCFCRQNVDILILHGDIQKFDNGSLSIIHHCKLISLKNTNSY